MHIMTLAAEAFTTLFCMTAVAFATIFVGLGIVAVIEALITRR